MQQIHLRNASTSQKAAFAASALLDWDSIDAPWITQEYAGMINRKAFCGESTMLLNNIDQLSRLNSQNLKVTLHAVRNANTSEKKQEK